MILNKLNYKINKDQVDLIKINSLIKIYIN